jgi:hypothetical protein
MHRKVGTHMHSNDGRTARLNGRTLGWAAATFIIMVVATVAVLKAGSNVRHNAAPPQPGPAISTPSIITAPSLGIADGPAAPPAASVPLPPMAASKPLRIRIAAIGVDSTLMGLGLKADGTMQVPPAGFPAGWYTGAPTPGELGPAIIVGHVDWAGKAGVFYRLKQLKPNDTIVVGRADGTSAIFRISSVQSYAKDKFPTALIYGNTTYAGLRLITCGGVFDPKAHSYVDNVVVYAELAGTSAAKAKT